MSPQTLTTVVHAAIVAIGLAGYVILTATGHDGNPVLTAALAWGGAAATEHAIEAKQTDTPTPTPPPAP